MFSNVILFPCILRFFYTLPCFYMWLCHCTFCFHVIFSHHLVFIHYYLVVQVVLFPHVNHFHTVLSCFHTLTHFCTLFCFLLLIFWFTHDLISTYYLVFKWCFFTPSNFHALPSSYMLSCFYTFISFSHNFILFSYIITFLYITLLELHMILFPCYFISTSYCDISWCNNFWLYTKLHQQIKMWDSSLRGLMWCSLTDISVFLCFSGRSVWPQRRVLRFSFAAVKEIFATRGSHTCLTSTYHVSVSFDLMCVCVISVFLFHFSVFDLSVNHFNVLFKRTNGLFLALNVCLYNCVYLTRCHFYFINVCVFHYVYFNETFLN